MIQGQAMIKVRGLSKAFGALRAVDALSFDAAANRVTSVIGPNGAGKSTAFNLIAGTLRPDAGTVELEGYDITGQPPYALTHLGRGRCSSRRITPRLCHIPPLARRVEPPIFQPDAVPTLEGLHVAIPRVRLGHTAQ